MMLAEIIFIAVLVLIVLALIAPGIIAIYSLLKKKKKFLVGACAAILMETVLVLFLASHQTYYKYNDWWIVGKTEEEIVERYGEFDMCWGSSKAYFIYVDNGWVMPDHQPHYYYIEFDDAGIATEVYESLAPGG